MNPKYRILIPVALAVLAAAANFVLLKRATATTDVLVLANDVPAGQPITRGDLKPAAVRAPADVFRAAYPAGNAVELETMTFRRDMKRGEIVLAADVNEDGQTFALRPGERAADLLVRSEVMPPGLTPNAQVEFVVGESDDGRHRTLGPFRYLGEILQTSANGKERYVRVCVAAADTGPLNDYKAAVHFDRGRVGRMIAVQRVATDGVQTAKLSGR